MPALPEGDREGVAVRCPACLTKTTRKHRHHWVLRMPSVPETYWAGLGNPWELRPVHARRWATKREALEVARWIKSEMGDRAVPMRTR